MAQNRHDLHRNGEEVHYPGQYFPKLMVDEASAFMEKNREKPFFMFYAVNTPHYPYQGTPKHLENAKDVPFPRNLYSAFVATQDEYLGKLLDKVEELGLTKDTIVVFQSDSGYSTEERAFSGGGDSGLYRGAKRSMHEGGIRLPAIISWPGKLPEGKVVDGANHTVDWLPTLATLAGVPYEKETIDGIDISADLRSEKDPEKPRVLHWELSYIGKDAFIVMDRDWKLIDHGDLKNETKILLYNLADDPSEAKNLAKRHPETVKRLADLRKEYLASFAP